MTRFFTSFLWIVSLTIMGAFSDEMNLAGKWDFALDRDNVGMTQKWFSQKLADRITLPGSLQEQGYGDLPSRQTPWTSGIGMKLLDDPRFSEYVNGPDFKCPFWLTPDRHYVGAAWYQKEVKIPRKWRGKRIILFLERPHWQTMVWLDDQKIGSADSLGVAHRFDLTRFVSEGKHRLTIRIDNGYIIPVGKDAHSISDQTQSNWNGITGEIKLYTTESVWVDDVQIYPNVRKKMIHVVAAVGNATNEDVQAELHVQAISRHAQKHHKAPRITIPVSLHEPVSTIELDYAMGDECQLWDEYAPHLYDLQLELTGKSFKSIHKERFGMRELGIQEKQFTINDRIIFLRGTLECCIFPRHGYPPTSVREWKKIIRRAKSYGLNHFRFHSWCPPEAAYVAADEEGFFFQVEASCWATFGDGTTVDEWIYQECDRMLKAYGNHPSFILMSPSNEPHGKKRDAFMGKLLTYLKNKDNRRFYTAGSGWPQIPENQYHVQYTTRLQRWPTLKFDQPPQTWDDYRSFVEKLSVPTVSHEIGQWCVYPDLREEKQYKGVLKAKNLAIFRDKLNQAGMGHLAHAFLMASGKFQTLLYKQEIEAALRTPHFAGFQLLDLHDFPGQGTAPVGVLNAFWKPKGYVTGKEYKQFCNDVVPLLRLKKRTWQNTETLEAVIDIANYSAKDLRDRTIRCRIKDGSGRILETLRFFPITIPTGGLTFVATVRYPLSEIQRASKVSLTLDIEGTPYRNSWDLWVYPQDDSPSRLNTIQILRDSREALNSLKTGASVLLVPPGDAVAGDTLGTFQPIFWNRITFPSQKVHTVGILCDPKHPALSLFPTDFHSNWQWQDLLDRSKPIIMDDLPKALQPIVQPIDDWNNCRTLGVLFEARVGKGRLMLCSMDIVSDIEERIVARQLRLSLLHYMASQKFHPQVELTEEQYQKLFRS